MKPEMKKKQVIKYSFVASFLLLALLVSSMLLTTAQAQSTRPNIIVFLVDDMGWQDTSVPFWKEKTPLNERYHTPNMERLAREGVKFTNAYATPVCTPTRVSLLTGMNAAHHRVTNWTNIARDKSTDPADDTFAPLAWNVNGLSPVAGTPHTVVATPLAQLLKDAGYFTIHVGKAHWGAMGTPGANPTNLGFVVNVGGHAAGHPQSYYGRQYYGNLPGQITPHAVPDLEAYYGSDTFLTEALTREALKTLEYPVAQRQPFFLHLSHYALHTPIQGDDWYLAKYLQRGLDSTEARYATLIEGMDKSLGDVMDYLKAKKMDGNTIILFMSDNGGLSQTPLRGGARNTHNLPLKVGKGSVHEGGIREPMLVKWPGVVKPGTVQDQYVIVEDFFPTILDMAGVRNPKTVQRVDGQSFVPLLRNPARRDQDRILVWHYPNKWGGGVGPGVELGPGINYVSALRQGDWKLIYLMREQRLELYNLAEDIGEHTDLAEKYPEKVRELAAALGQKLKDWQALNATLKTTGQPVPWPDEIGRR